MTQDPEDKTDRISLTKQASSPVGVARVDGQYRVFAAHDVEIGQLLLPLLGVIYPQPTRFSVQIADDQHIDLPAGVSTEEAIDQYPWRFLNHACQPTGVIRGRELVAARPVTSGEEITFNYNSTEWDMSTPFDCECGSTDCQGLVQGFKHLPLASKQRILSSCAPHIQALAQSYLQSRS